MNLRTISWTSGVLAAVAAFLATTLAVLAPGAAALEQDRVTLVPDQTQVVDYFPLLGNNPGATADPSTTISTEICMALTACDVVPLTVPDPGHEDDFFVTITLNWDTAEVPNLPLLGDTAVNDLDLWIVDDPFVEDAGPDEDGFHYKSAGTAEPEVVQMYRPIGNFNILVVNATGVNTGYRLTFDWRTDPLPNIFESLPPGFTSGPLRPTAAPQPATPVPAAPSFDLPDPEPIRDLPSAAPVAAAPDLRAGAALTPDSSFSSGFGDAPSLDEELAGPPLRQFEPTTAVKAAPPSTASLLLWLLAVPLALLAIGAALLNRRRSALLQI